MQDWNRSASRSTQAWLLLLLLLLLTAYRLWIIPRLGVTLYIDEAQYWTWAKDLDWGYYSKPPVIAWLIAATTAVFGDGLLAVKLSALLLYPATAWLLYLLGRRLYDGQTGFRAGLSFALIPLVSALGLAVSTDAPLLFCWALAMLALLRALEYDRWRDWLLLGVAVGLGIMAKYTMGAFAASAGLYLLTDRQRRRAFLHPGLWIAVALATLIVLPNILWNWQHDFPTLRHTAEITHVSENAKTGNAGEFLLAQAGSLGPGFALAYLVGIGFALRRWHDPRSQFLLSFSLPLFGLVFFQAMRSEANGNWAAPALIAALLLSVVWLTRLRTRWWLGALAINIAVMLAAYYLGDYFQLTGKPQPARLDPLKRAKGWDALADGVRPYFAAHPGAMLLTKDRTLMAHLSYELRDLDLDAVAWAPNPHPADHYQLTVPLQAANGIRPLILVTQSGDDDVAPRFARREKLGDVIVDVMPGLQRHVEIILLEGFRGY